MTPPIRDYKVNSGKREVLIRIADKNLTANEIEKVRVAADEFRDKVKQILKDNSNGTI